jgi:DNA-binding NarL/FixJ family response regulator
MKKITNIIIVDDHPFIIEGYKNGIKAYNPTKFEYTVCQAKDCQSAYEMITSPDCASLDVAFLDISMPPYDEKGMRSGVDLAWLIKETFPECKIILLTMHNELIEITEIIDSLNPNGLIIKNDLTFQSMLFGFDKVLKGETYYSESIVEFLSRPKFENVGIDQFDRQILFQLSKGTKVKMIPEYVPLTATAVDRRRLHMKEILEITDGTDASLVLEAKRRSII